MRINHIVLVFASVFVIAACSPKIKINPGTLVRVDYKGTLKDGSIFDSTEGKQPLAFMVGANQVLPAFEKQIITMSQGQSRKFTISSKDAYGKPDPSKLVTLPRDDRFKTLDLKEGAIIFANNKGPNGRIVQTPMKIVKLTDKEVSLDYNHPLAGKDLNFEVKLIETKQAQLPQPAQALPQASANPQ